MDYPFCMKKKPKAHIVAIIPARYASTRFPGKPLTKILGKTLIQRTYENAQRCTLLDELIVATDDKRIYDHVAGFGGKVVMTPVECPTGSDRLAHVVENDPALKQAEVIINIQGDEPCLDPKATQGIIEALLADPSAVMSTGVYRLHSEEEARNPSMVKCVLDLQGNVLYFSRALIPGNHTLSFDKKTTYYKHVGIYAFRPAFLLQYARMPMTPLQKSEDLEQLKVLENGYKIKAALIESVGVEVNTPEDINKVEKELCKQNSFSSRAGSVRRSAKG